MFTRNRRRRAFTLVELILVVIMLGLLAAIVIPKFASGRQDAGEAALKQNLKVLRTAIQRYFHHHNGVYPAAAAAGDGNGEAGTAAAFINQLAKYTDVLGAASDTQDATHVFGPYLKTGIPVSSVGTISGKSDVKVVIVNGLTPDKSTGWLYSTVTGEFVANTDELSSEDTAYNNW